jgi:hypothetical protein
MAVAQVSAGVDPPSAPDRGEDGSAGGAAAAANTAGSGTTTRGGGRRRTAFLLGVVAAAAALPHLGVVCNDFLTWDDSIIILGQPFLRELTFENLARIFSPFPAREEWLPVRDLTLALNFALFGEDPAWFGAGNLLCHVAVALAAFFLFRRLCGGGAGVAGR